jgi:hypothetical protein
MRYIIIYEMLTFFGCLSKIQYTLHDVTITVTVITQINTFFFFFFFQYLYSAKFLMYIGIVIQIQHKATHSYYSTSMMTEYMSAGSV